MRSESVHMLEFPQHGDERGHLVVVEGLKDIPFEIKRVFYISPNCCASACPLWRSR